MYITLVNKNKMFPGRKKSKLSHSGQKDADDTYHVSSNENLSFKESKEGAEKFKNMYDIHFLGIVPEIIMNNTLTRDNEAQLVDRIEEAQIEGILPVVAQDDSKVKVNISIHGVKVLDVKGQEVLQRHPLHTVAQVVQYNDGADVNNIVFKIGQVNKPVFSAYVFQCISEEQAQIICQSVRAMFDRVTVKHR